MLPKTALAVVTLLTIQACNLTINTNPECEESCEASSRRQSHILDVDYTTTNTPPKGAL